MEIRDLRPSGPDKGTVPYRQMRMRQTEKRGGKDRLLGSCLPEVREVDTTLVQGGVTP